MRTVPKLPRVMMVARLFYPWVGGAERQAQKLAQTMIGKGTAVQISTGWWWRGTPQQELLTGVPIFRNQTLWEFFGIKGLRKFGGYLYIISLIWHLRQRRDDYDVIQCAWSKLPYLCGCVGRALVRAQSDLQVGQQW